MSKVNMSWDLKNNKTVTYTSAYLAAGEKTISDEEVMYDCYNIFKKATIQLKDFKKVKTADGKKYKVTYSLVFTYPNDFSQSEIYNIYIAGAFERAIIGLDFWWGSWTDEFVVDYQTGENLSVKNDYGVKVKEKHLEGEYIKHIPVNTDGWGDGWWGDHSTETYKMTIIYPVGYKDLCILGCGNSDRFSSVMESSGFHESGNNNFYDLTSWYSKTDKSVCHGMRVK